MKSQLTNPNNSQKFFKSVLLSTFFYRQRYILVLNLYKFYVCDQHRDRRPTLRAAVLTCTVL